MWRTSTRRISALNQGKLLALTRSSIVLPSSTRILPLMLLEVKLLAYKFISEFSGIHKT